MTATVVLIVGADVTVAHADSMAEMLAVMTNRRLNRMDVTRGAETSYIVISMQIFSVRCSASVVRRTPGDQFEPNWSIGRSMPLSFHDQRPSRLNTSVTWSLVPFRAVAVTVDQFL